MSLILQFFKISFQPVIFFFLTSREAKSNIPASGPQIIPPHQKNKNTTTTARARQVYQVI